jgi:pantetheine-phosphate adenylyltransferase
VVAAGDPVYPRAMARVAVFPGTFDPVTYGHLDLLRRGSRLFDRVVVGVSEEGKSTLFDAPARVRMVEEEARDLENVRVERFSGLVVELARRVGAEVLLRGVRTLQDWEYELRMAHANRSLAPGVETLFLAPAAEWSFLSSSLTREVASLGGDVSPFVPPAVAEALRARFPKRETGRMGRPSETRS